MQSPATQDLDPYGIGRPETWENPYPAMARLRAEAPVHFSHPWQGWLLTRYEDVLAGFRDPRLSSKRSGAFVRAMPEELRRALAPVGRNLASWALLSDPPDHTRLRGLINKAFTPRMTERLRPRIQSLVDTLLEDVAPRGGMDAIADFANPLPVTVIGEMMGLPTEDWHRLKQWSDAIAGFFGAVNKTMAVMEASSNAVLEMEDYLRHAISLRRAHPGEDLISQLLAAEEKGQLLNEQELLSSCTMLLFGGHETTTNLIGNGFYALLNHPEQKHLLQASPGLWPDAVEEFLRFDTPVTRQMRVATESFKLHGQEIQQGQLVALMLISANRDASQFPDADTLEVRRSDNRHLSLGMGTHYCVGASLGRLEAQLALSALFKRFPDLRLEGGPPPRVPNVTVRGFLSLPIRF